jgi:hypothetical protein
MAGGLRILLAGMLAGDPRQGGATWAVLQYLEGLLALGHDVVVVEPVPKLQLERGGGARAYYESLALPDGRAALLALDSDETLGLTLAELLAFAVDADVLLNLSGLLRDPRLLEPIEVRAFVDLDPGFNQLWHLQGQDMGLDLHTHFVTVGGLLGTPGCPAPTAGRDWIATLPPVSLAHWPLAPDPPCHDAFTTVGHWRSYGSLEHDGLHYGQRAHSLRELIDLPGRTDSRFQIALGIHPEERSDLRVLAANGWELLDPGDVAATPARYRDFVAGSKAEIGIAKSGYVASSCGWFSDRSACYLASGRPVLAQDTGFGQILPTGQGLLAFSDAAQAAAAVEEVETHLARHRLAARAIAEEHLDARRVLGGLLERLAGAPLDPAGDPGLRDAAAPLDPAQRKP